jgi:inner membrane protein
MEPITHFLTGACIGRAGLNRKTAYATLVAVLAAEAADIDVLWALAGPVEELKHHRGITHTFIAVPVVAAAAAGAVWLIDRGLRAWRTRRANTLNQIAQDGCPTLAASLFLRLGWDTTKLAKPKAAGPTAGGLRLGWDAQPIRWGWLYLTALLSALSHLLLDWTNNYGLRPFYPFNPRWYSGSFVFIVEPVLLGVLTLALLMPWLLGLADSEIGAKKAKFHGRGWAIFALTAMVLLWGWRRAEQGRARMLLGNAPVTTAPVKRVGLEPYPINPFRWHAIVETPEFYQTAEINALTGEITSDRHSMLYKPPATAATEAAKRTLLGQVYLDWGAWGVVRDVGPIAAPGMAPPQLPPGRQWTTVQFTDLRFNYYLLSANENQHRTPLDGWVYIVDGREDAGEAMNGREQR